MSITFIFKYYTNLYLKKCFASFCVISWFVGFNVNKSWPNNKKWRMQGSKTVEGLPRDPKMVLGQRVLIVEGQEGPRLGRWSNLVDQNLR